MKILIIDEDLNFSTILSHQLRNHGYSVFVAHSAREGIEQFRANTADVVVFDLQSEDITGVDLLGKLRAVHSNVICIVFIACGNIDVGVEMCQRGFDDYLVKPFSKQQLIFTIEKAVRLRTLQSENMRLREAIQRTYQFGNIITQNAGMEQILGIAMKASQNELPVILLGERGTGKEYLARTIHENSFRKNFPFVKINCSGISPGARNVEFFRDEEAALRGGAEIINDTLMLVPNSCIFFDEISLLNKPLQERLADMLTPPLQAGYHESVLGENGVRLMASSSQPLEELRKSTGLIPALLEKFQENVISLPPLKARVEDIPCLVKRLIEEYSPEKSYTIEPEFMDILQSYEWPGNVRELGNVLRRCVLLANDAHLRPALLPAHIRIRHADVFSILEKYFVNEFSLQNLERCAILEALRQSKGNRSRAARILKIPRHVLLYRLKKFGIDKEWSRGA